MYIRTVVAVFILVYLVALNVSSIYRLYKKQLKAIYSLLEKTLPPPWFTKFEFEKFFSLFYIISTQRNYIYPKLDTNSCFAKLRAISNLFSFFYTCTLYSEIINGVTKLTM